MSDTFTRKIQQGRKNFYQIRSQAVVRVWNLAKRLNPKTMVQEYKKRGFSKYGNKGK